MSGEPSLDALLRRALDRSLPASLRRLEHDRLRERARQTPLDALARAQLTRCGEPLDEALAVEWRPGVGEALVPTTGPCGASVGRLAVRREGAPYALQGGLRASAAAQARASLEAAAACAAAAGRGVPASGARGHAVSLWTPDGVEIDGTSLGLAAAVAFVSCWSGTAPRPDVAASAAVARDGTLTPVAGLHDKARALRERYPYVRELVVALQQPPDGAASLEGLTLVRCGDLAAALGSFGLDPAAVEGGRWPAAARERALAELAHTNVPTYEPAAWRALATKARMCAAESAGTERLRALGWAALLHLHAGDAIDAAEIARELAAAPLDALSDAPRVWVRIVLATAAIDRDPAVAAVALAREALADAETLGAEDRAELLGRTHGTLGRALVHAQRAEEAIAHLAAGVAHHREHRPRELARSAIYLATGSRRAGRLDEALAAVEEAFEAIEAQADEEESATSRLHALYERARVHVARGDERAAREDLLALVAAQGIADAYPSVGAYRYLAMIEPRLADGDGARWLELACEQAESLRPGPLRQVAAAAAGEVLWRGAPPPHLAARLEAVWRAVMGEGAGEAALDALVY